MPKVEVDGIRINYELHGSGEPVVLIGGLGADTSLWFCQAPELSKHFQLIAFDNRGAGESDKPDEPYSIPMFAADTAGLMRALGIDRAHILGASLGGLIAQEFALTYPSMLDRLVLVCTSFAGRQSVRPSLLTVLSIVMAVRRSGNPEADTRRSFAVFTSKKWRQAHPDVIDRFVEWRVAHPQPPYAFKRQRDALRGFTTADRVAGIAAPTLIVHGDSDRVVPVANARLLAERIPNSRLAVLEDSGHACSIDQAETFNRVVIDFLCGR
jgi:pimeloyl-ACP methyl ester carboxylesterase